MTPRAPALPVDDPLLSLRDRLDGFTAWADVGDVLHSEWLALHDGRGRCLIHVRDGLGLVERPGLLRARERRGLHRRGYRLEHLRGVRVWLWTQDEPPADPGAPCDVVTSLRRWQEHGQGVRDQALRTVRDVLGADVGEVAVVLLPEDDAEEDEGWDECGCAAPRYPRRA